LHVGPVDCGGELSDRVFCEIVAAGAWPLEDEYTLPVLNIAPTPDGLRWLVGWVGKGR